MTVTQSISLLSTLVVFRRKCTIYTNPNLLTYLLTFTNSRRIPTSFLHGRSCSRLYSTHLCSPASHFPVLYFARPPVFSSREA